MALTLGSLSRFGSDSWAFFEARSQVDADGLGGGLSECLGADLLDADLGAVAVHGGRADGDEDGSTFFDGVDVEDLRLVQQGRHAVLELNEGTDQVIALAVVVGLGGETGDRGAQAGTFLEGGDFSAQAGRCFLPGGDDLAVGDLVFVEDDAGSGLGRLVFVDLALGHAGFFDEDLQGHAGAGNQQLAPFVLGFVVLAGQKTVGDEAVGIALDGDDHAAVGVMGDGGDGTADGGASGDGDGGGLGGAGGGVQFRSFQIRV